MSQIISQRQVFTDTRNRPVEPEIHANQPHAVEDDLSVPERLVSKKAVTAMIGVAYPTLWKWMQQGKFPRALDCNGIPRWKLSDLTQWIATRPERQYGRGSRCTDHHTAAVHSKASAKWPLR